MNLSTNIFWRNYEFYDNSEIARASYLRTPHDGLRKDLNVKQHKFSSFDYSINIIHLETIRRIDDYLTQTLNVRIRL